jgi:LuxR family transcriptional regulator, maltose regulon positive regulatory protein
VVACGARAIWQSLNTARTVRPARPRDDQPAGPASTAAGAPVVTEELSDREREVLQRAASMLSNAEIAGELYISVNTVKTHLGSIYRKLGAADRRQAVRSARHLKVI